MDRRKATHNSGLAKGGVSWFLETFVQGSTFVLRMKFCAKNPALRQAAKRYRIFVETVTKQQNDYFEETLYNITFTDLRIL